MEGRPHQERSAGTALIHEATVAGLQSALARGEVTCVEIVQASLDRVAACDRRGPSLHALITVNPRALDEAEACDRARARGRALGSLHGMPLVLKDNFHTRDLPTTSGVVALAGLVPMEDACVVSRLRAAGAVIVGKANMTELAYGGTSVSALGGQVLNPYDLTRTPGGSSGGTGAALAASYAVLGTGSDTGQSIRSPASACALVGIRPTRGLVSRHGIVPFSPTQDEVGPITRTVEDAARMLDVMAGPDPRDPLTERGRERRPRSYLDALDAGALRGARLGLLTQMMGREPVHAPVNDVIERAVEALARCGARVVPVEIAGLNALTDGLSLMSFEFAEAMAAYFASLGDRAPVRTLAELVARGECHPSLAAGLARDAAVIDGTRSREYAAMLARRDRLRAAVLDALNRRALDALIYPHQRRLAVPVGEDQVDRNGVIANSTGLPAVVIPAGFSPSSDTAPLGVPVGLELLGRDFAEPRLLALAFAWDRQQGRRLAPMLLPGHG